MDFEVSWSIHWFSEDIPMLTPIDGFSRSRRTDPAGFEAVGLGLGHGREADAVFERDAVDPVAVLEVENSQHQISHDGVCAGDGR